ncbi:MAG: ABC transporter substrate-binding protein [Nitrospirae bacterium]|jgi:iron complex transport system substrate-binding protein|nr:ABC transporter substrate-binding protein [Nitrospirota bacterium]
MKVIFSNIFVKVFYIFLIISIGLLLYQHEVLSQTYPQRIISLAPSITEELYLLGIENRIIGVTTYCKKPIQAQKVGTIIEVNIEKVISLQPDLVLATSLTNPKAKEKLKNLGIKVITFPSAKNFREICEQFLELGKIVGREKKAEEIVYRAKKTVSSLKQKVKELPKPKVLVQVGAKPLWVAPEDSFVNDLIESAGGINIVVDSKTGLYSREEVLKQNPDVIIITTMGIVGKEEKKIWQKYKTISAVRNNRIYIVDSDRFCSPTPVSFVDTLKEMVNILHPHTYEK